MRFRTSSLYFHLGVFPQKLFLLPDQVYNHLLKAEYHDFYVFDFMVYWHPSVLRDNGVCARRCQSVVELQRRLWLLRPILERQTLLQLLPVETLSSKGAVSVSALLRLRALFSSHCSSLFCSAVSIADSVVYRQLLRSAASASKPAGAIPLALRSRLSTFKYHKFSFFYI